MEVSYDENRSFLSPSSEGRKKDHGDGSTDQRIVVEALGYKPQSLPRYPSPLWLIDSGDDPEGDWDYVNASDPIGIVGEYLGEQIKRY